jgi:hypothetical protein
MLIQEIVAEEALLLEALREVMAVEQHILAALEVLEEQLRVVYLQQ